MQELPDEKLREDFVNIVRIPYLWCKRLLVY